MGQRLGVYRHDAILAEVPVEGTEIRIRHGQQNGIQFHKHRKATAAQW